MGGGLLYAELLITPPPRIFVETAFEPDNAAGQTTSWFAKSGLANTNTVLFSGENIIADLP